MSIANVKRKMADIDQYIEELETFYRLSLDAIDQLIDHIFLVACDEDFLTEDMADILDELQETVCNAAERFALNSEIRR